MGMLRCTIRLREGIEKEGEDWGSERGKGKDLDCIYC